jgi:adenylate cyclase
MKFDLQKSWPALLGALFSAGLGWLLLNYPVGRQLVYLSYDLPFGLRHKLTPPPTPHEVAIVFLDDESTEKLGQPKARTWDRLPHARLLERLIADGARSVTYDIFFADASPPEKKEQDDRFAEAMKRSGRVILGVNPTRVGYDATGAEARGTALITPYERFAEQAANLGSVEQSPAEDLVIRWAVPYTKKDIVPPLAWATAETVGIPAATNDTVRFSERWLNYYGPPRTIPNYSFYRVISTNRDDQPPPPGFFKNKSVFVGGAFQTYLASDRKDEFPTPFWTLRIRDNYDRFMSGVEVHATAFLNLVRGEWLTRTSSRSENWLVLLSGVVFGFGMKRARPLAATLAAAGGMAVFAIVGYWMHTRLRIWYPWAIIVFGIIPVAWGWGVFHNAFSLLVQKRVLEQSLSRYLSPKLVKIFANKPEFLQTGAEKQVLTILFSDIANFTGLSEGMDSDQLARLVNSYFDRAVPSCIFKTDGTVIKFIGDAIFAIWNAPETQSDHQLRACRAALLLRDQLSDFALDGSSVRLRTRIGLHTGVANVGNFGSAEKFGYDAIGENINLASRMEGLNKHLGTDVLVTGETHGAVSGQLITRRLGAFRLKGFEKAVEVFELVSELDRAEDSRNWRESFAGGLEHFERSAFDEADTAFRRTLELKPGDGPSQFYRDRISEMKSQPPGAAWTAVIELKEK